MTKTKKEGISPNFAKTVHGHEHCQLASLSFLFCFCSTLDLNTWKTSAEVLRRQVTRYKPSFKNKPNENEIIINVLVAIGMMSSGFLWPVSAWNELVSGELIVPGDEVTVSPR